MAIDSVLATIVAGGQAQMENTQRLIEIINNYFNLVNLCKSLDNSLGKIMRKDVCPLGSINSSNPCCQRGWRLHHHGGGVCCVFVLRVVVLSGCCHLSNVDKYHVINLR